MALQVVWFTNSIGGAPTGLTYGLGQELVPDLIDLHAFSVDFTPPSFDTFPADATVQCDAYTDPTDTGSPTASDNCGPNTQFSPKITYTDATNLSGCGGYTGTITRTWTATDACGNTITQDQVITVEDTQAPQVVWSQGDIWRRANAGLCTSEVYWTEPVAGTDYWDNCTAAGDIVVSRRTAPATSSTQARRPP